VTSDERVYVSAYVEVADPLLSTDCFAPQTSLRRPFPRRPQTNPPALEGAGHTLVAKVFRDVEFCPTSPIVHNFKYEFTCEQDVTRSPAGQRPPGCRETVLFPLASLHARAVLSNAMADALAGPGIDSSQTGCYAS